MSEKLILAVLITCLLQMLANLSPSASPTPSTVRAFEAPKIFTENSNRKAENPEIVIPRSR